MRTPSKLVADAVALVTQGQRLTERMRDGAVSVDASVGELRGMVRRGDGVLVELRRLERTVPAAKQAREDFEKVLGILRDSLAQGATLIGGPG